MKPEDYLITIRHDNYWYWGRSITLIINDCSGIVTISFDNDNKNVCHIHGLSVLPGRRNKGIGNYLLNVAEQFAIYNNCNEILIDADKRDKWIKDWYKRRGYKVYRYGRHLYNMKKTIIKQNGSTTE